MKKIIKNPLIILAAGVLILAGSSVGATRAAMTYSEAAERVEFETDALYVDIQEEQGSAGYVSVGGPKHTVGVLSLTSVKNQITDKNPLQVGSVYDENVKIQNTSTGDYDEYVRVLVRKSWVKNNGEKDTRLDPSLIELQVTSDWFEDSAKTTTEGTIYYCKKPVPAGTGIQFIDGISFGDGILEGVTTKDVTEDGTIVKNVYAYDGKTFQIEIRVDAVQTHHAEEAILGAWGVHATVNDSGEITSLH
jgi:hypothetical protein